MIDLDDVITRVESPGYASEHTQFVAKLRRKHSFENVKWGTLGLVIGGVLTVYGMVGIFGGYKLHLQSTFLLLGLFICAMAIAFIIRNLRRAVLATQVGTTASVEDLCEWFYEYAFCKKTTDNESKEDQIVNAIDIFPIPVLKAYESTGWKVLVADSVAGRENALPLECAICHKKTPNSTPFNSSIPVVTHYKEEFFYKEDAKTRKLIETIYTKCEHCGNVLCYNCLCYSQPKERRYICQACNKTMDGWKGLAERWKLCRLRFADNDVDFEITDLSVQENPSIHTGIVDITVHLTGEPFGQVRFSNSILRMGERAFLLNPEPEMVI